MLSSALLASLSIGSFVCAVPLVTRHEILERKLLGSSFGLPQNATFDYIVVGGGNAGLTIAARLAENSSLSVAVIEAGGFYEIENGNVSQIPAYDARGTGKDPTDTDRVDWGFVTTPQEELHQAKVHYPRGKTLGGSTARNFMAYHRGTVGAYAKWADMVGDDSYKFDRFAEFFEKSLNFTPPSSRRPSNATPQYDESTMGNGNGMLQVTYSHYAYAFSSWVQRGFEQIGIMPQNGFTSGTLNGSSYVLETINARTQLRESSETAFLRPALRKSGLTVFQSTLATRILFDAQKKSTGVICSSAGLEYVLSARKEVVLSAGAFQSPQLLMVSGVGPHATLRQHGIDVVADRPGVGKNMWDHVQMGPSFRVDLTTISSLGNLSTLLAAEQQLLDHQDGILTSPVGEFLAWEKIPERLRAGFSEAVQSALATSFPDDWPEVEYLCMSTFLGYQQNYWRDAPTDGYNYATVSVALVAPLSRGTVSITSANMADPPIIDPQWLSHPADRAVVVAGYKRTRELFQSSAMQRILIGPEYFPGENVTTDAEILEIIRRTANTVWHAAGTCAMGRPEDPNAVVDVRGRVFGVAGLRVVDASAFPLLPPGHPSATVYALAEKIAHDMLYH